MLLGEVRSVAFVEYPPGLKTNFVAMLISIFQARRLNATTMNVAEKRTAETKMAAAAAMEEAASEDGGASELGSGLVSAAGPRTHSGLALLPIVAILCGVAVALATVALGVLLLVRGRGSGAEEVAEGAVVVAAVPGGGDVGDGSIGDGRGKYDKVATNAPPEEDMQSRQIRQGMCDNINFHYPSSLR